jgi:hypothetical protein
MCAIVSSVSFARPDNRTRVAYSSPAPVQRVPIRAVHGQAEEHISYFAMPRLSWRRPCRSPTAATFISPYALAPVGIKGDDDGVHGQVFQHTRHGSQQQVRVIWNPSTSNVANHHLPSLIASPPWSVICLWHGCGIFFIEDTPERLFNTFKGHFKGHVLAGNGLKHCFWMGCACRNSRQGRCTNLGPSHTAHVKDVWHHVKRSHFRPEEVVFE